MANRDMDEALIRAIKEAGDDKITTESGATSSYCPDFGQILLEALELLAQRFEMGEVKHGRNNWRKGLGNKKYTLERINHIIRHCYQLIDQVENGIPDMNAEEIKEYDMPAGNVGAILWGGAFLSLALGHLKFIKKIK